MIVKYTIMKPKIKNIEKVCNYLDCTLDDLYYIEGIKDNLFKAENIFLKENKLSYCKNKSGYPFVKYSIKNAIIVNKKFIDDLKVIDRILNRNKQRE